MKIEFQISINPDPWNFPTRYTLNTVQVENKQDHHNLYFQLPDTLNTSNVVSVFCYKMKRELKLDIRYNNSMSAEVHIQRKLSATTKLLNFYAISDHQCMNWYLFANFCLAKDLVETEEETTAELHKVGCQGFIL